MKCKKCGKQLSEIGKATYQLDGDLCKTFSFVHCYACKSTFKVTDYYSMNYTGSDCEEVSLAKIAWSN